MKIQRILPFLICSAIIIFFLSIVLKNSVNIPNGDDLYCLMLFTQQFQDASSFGEHLKLLTEQWIEHRIVYSRLTALISYWIHGQVNFLTIIMIGNLTLIGFTILFWKLLKRTGVSMYYLIPVVLTLFSPVMYEANVWAGASTVYMPVCFLGLLTVYLLAMQSRLGFVIATAAAMLATFSFGNGMFSFIAGFCVLIYQQKFKYAGIWTALAIGTIGLYFYQFQDNSNTDAFGLAAHFRYPAYLFYNLFGFIGGTADYLENLNTPFQRNNIPTIVFGFGLSVAILAGIYYSFLRKNTVSSDKKDSFLKTAWLGMVIFIGFTSLAISYSRTSGEAMNALSSRYKIYSMISFILVYVWFLMFFKRKVMVAWLFGGFSLLLLVFNYFLHYEKIVNYKSVFLSGSFNYHTDKQWLIYRNTAYYEHVSKLLCDSISKNPRPVYIFFNTFPELNHNTLKAAAVLDQVQISEERNEPGRPGRWLTVKSDEYPKISNFHKGVYLVVYNDQKIFLFSAGTIKNGRLNILTKGDYFKDGFFLNETFDKVLTPGASYKLGVFCPTSPKPIVRLNYEIKG